MQCLVPAGARVGRAGHTTPSMRQPSVPASPAGGCCRQGSAGRFWLSPVRCQSSVRSGHPASSVEHRIRACGLELGSFGGSRSPAPGIADDCGSRDDEVRLRNPRKLSFASVSAERYALSAYTSEDVLAWFKSPSNFRLSCTLASVTSYCRISLCLASAFTWFL